MILSVKNTWNCKPLIDYLPELLPPDKESMQIYTHDHSAGVAEIADTEAAPAPARPAARPRPPFGGVKSVGVFLLEMYVT